MTPRALVLVVEDEPALVDLLTIYLSKAGYAVRSVGDGTSALAVIRSERPVLVLLDIGLPGSVDGIEVCRRLRAEGDLTPIIFVTALDEEVDRVVGLELGGDDYVTKPYSPRELVARVRSVIRRYDAGARAAPEAMRLGDVRLDVAERRCWVGEERVELTTTEFDLLGRLMSTPGRVYRRGQLLSEVWGYPADDTSRTVDVYVAQVRAKLGAASPIRTVRGVGYSAEAPPTGAG